MGVGAAGQVPALKDTLARYLRSMKPLLSRDDYAKAKEEGTKFIEGEGARLHR